MIKPWIKTWTAKWKVKGRTENPQKLSKNTNKNSDFYENYYTLVAHAAKLKLVEPMFNLNIFPLFENKAYVLESDIIETLDLHPIRAKKWLNLLASEFFLKQIMISNQAAYQLSEEFYQLMHGDGWATMKSFFATWIIAANEDLTDVLRFGKVKETVPWPPKTKDEAKTLETWMTLTAECTIACVLEQIDFKNVNHLLDVGGGDGTMACAFVTVHPHLKATVYNLPASAHLARQNIASKGLSDRVSVIEGDFIKDDTLPAGFDLILFSRVLFDWEAKVNRKLLKMAYDALPLDGQVVICEIFKDYNPDFCLSSEYRYLFLDDFTTNVMKTEAEYRIMLGEIGFSVLPKKPSGLSAEYASVLLAKK